MIKIGVVVQRYGKDVVGGAETLAKNIADRLNSNGFDVTVFTTTAKDYITWKNHYNQGESILKGVNIKRFNVERERDIESFNRHSEEFFIDDSQKRDEMDWIIRQGPYCPDLIDALKNEQKFFDIFLFFTYLYYPTVEGIKVVEKPIVLFPTAHDESPIYLNLMNQVFKKPDSLFFLTGAEMNFVRKLFNPNKRMELVRTGIDINDNIDEKLFKRKYLMFLPYMLYAGRIERGKGLDLIFDAYGVIRKKRLVTLVLIGKKLMDIPEIDGINYLGYVTEDEKISAFKDAVLSIQPSPMESLSITTLESFSQKTPVLANRKSDVLKEHIELSEGGLLYDNVEDFVENFTKIYDKRNLRNKMGINGYNYVNKFYSWDVVIGKIANGIKNIIKG